MPARLLEGNRQKPEKENEKYFLKIHITPNKNQPSLAGFIFNILDSQSLLQVYATAFTSPEAVRVPIIS
jgi:hypothetical protein